MPTEDKHTRNNLQPSSTTLRARKLLLTVASSRRRFQRDWQARADWLMSRAIEISWMGRLAAVHREKSRLLKLPPDWRQQWQRDDEGLPIASIGNVVIALHEDDALRGRVVDVDGFLHAVAIEPGAPSRKLTKSDIAKTVAYLHRLGLNDVGEEIIRTALLIVAREKD